MKQFSKEGIIQKEKNDMILEEKYQNTFKSKQNIKLEKEKQELSPIALMQHRIEEMHRKLFEKRNQRKLTK